MSIPGDDGDDVQVLCAPDLDRKEEDDAEKATMQKPNDPLQDVLFGEGAEHSYRQQQTARREPPRLVKDGKRESAASGAVGKEPPAADDTGQAAVEDDIGPNINEPYRAFGHPRPYPLHALLIYFNALERKKYGMKKMQVQYADVESDEPGRDGLAADGQSFSFVVRGNRKTLRIKVCGREVERGYDLFTLRKLPWLRSVDRDFGQMPGEVITSIDVEVVVEER